MGNNKNRDYLLSDEIPLTLPVIPTIDVVVFPQMVVPLLILDEKIIKGVEEAAQGSKKIFLLAAQQDDNSYQSPISINDLYSVGTVGNIMRIMHLPEGGIKILTQGLVKAHVEEILSGNDNLQVRIKAIDEKDMVYDEEKVNAELKNLYGIIDKIASTGRIFGPDFQAILGQIQSPDRIADFILSHLNPSVEQAQSLLEKDSLDQLLSGISEFLQLEYDMTDMQEKIQNNARHSINKSQREYYLREQMKAIQKELGDDSDSDIEDLRRKLYDLPLTEEARAEGVKQFKRLQKTAPDSMEGTVIRNHLEWLLGLPWGTYTKDNLNVKHAREVLDNHHYGIAEVKERILDFLSIKSLKDDCNVPILCFAGSPGVGKTSLGRSIAECLGRNYFRIALGGVSDESEIRGHRRTYVGALPGRFIQAVRKSGSMNPLIIIDEIDKIGSSNRGDPSSALLEVLDPEQNKSFYDNYLGVHFDLSQCLFVTTANDLSRIPAPLRDRMEIIELSGYTTDEKEVIAMQHLIPKAIKNSGLGEAGITIDRPVVSEIIQGYTREAGVRDLERNIQKLCSKYARIFVERNEPTSFTLENIHEHLGPRKIPAESLIKMDRIGVCNGLAWTPFGGEILLVETALTHGSGKLVLTGQLGKVMQESARAALTYIKAHADFFGIDYKAFNHSDIHIHLPAGGIPKDGPSGGIALVSALLSSFTKRAVNGDFAMTGELNLQGEVLPIGGVKEKILAAKQNGLQHVIVPKLNQKDLVGLEKIQEGLSIHFVSNVKEVIDFVLLPGIIQT